jgi:hypothetical protein
MIYAGMEKMKRIFEINEQFNARDDKLGKLMEEEMRSGKPGALENVKIHREARNTISSPEVRDFMRKAIGAKKKDINLQFLAEAIALTFTGGVIGVILGITVALTVSKLGIIQTSISIPSIFLAFGVSAFIGIVFGYYPARRASNLNPIEALRYE